jgi:CubicO group peptidase (beta-lactamase class C family)
MPSPIGVADLVAGLFHAASDSFGSLYRSPRTMMAQAIRAILLASATASGVRPRWGFGNMINLDPVEGGRQAGSPTWAGLYNTYYWIDPASDVARVIMMQILPFADTRALNVYRQFERGIYRALKAA